MSAGGGLDGLAMLELPVSVRVGGDPPRGRPGALEHPPRRDTTPRTRYDDAYLVGPYAELLEVLRPDREGAGAPGGASPLAPRGIGARRSARSAIIATRRSIVGHSIPCGRPRAAPIPGIASSSGSRPAAMSRCIELPSVSGLRSSSPSASAASTRGPLGAGDRPRS